MTAYSRIDCNKSYPDYPTSRLFRLIYILSTYTPYSWTMLSVWSEGDTRNIYLSGGIQITEDLIGRGKLGLPLFSLSSFFLPPFKSYLKVCVGAVTSPWGSGKTSNLSAQVAFYYYQ